MAKVVLATAIGIAGAVFSIAGPASAETASPASHAKAAAVQSSASEPKDVHAAGWLGQCYGVIATYSAGGWCDGNGPDAFYRGWVKCSDGGWYYGTTKWAGDRTGSYVRCGSGVALDGGVYGWTYP